MLRHHQFKLVLLTIFLNWGIYRVAHGSTMSPSIHFVHDYISDDNLLDLDEESQTEFEHMKNAALVQITNNKNYQNRSNNKVNIDVNNQINTNENNNNYNNSSFHSNRSTTMATPSSTTIVNSDKISTAKLKWNTVSVARNTEPDIITETMKIPLKKSVNTINKKKDFIVSNYNSSNNNNTLKSMIVSDNKYEHNNLDANTNNANTDDDDDDEFYDDNYDYDDDNDNDNGDDDDDDEDDDDDDDNNDDIYNYNDDYSTTTTLIKSKTQSQLQNKNKYNLNSKNPFKLKPIKGYNSHISSNAKTTETTDSENIRNDLNKETNKIHIDKNNNNDVDDIKGNKKLKNEWINYDNEDGDIDDDDNRDDAQNENDFDDDVDEDNEDINDINDEEDIVFSQSTVCPRYCTCERNANNYLVAYCSRIDPDTQKFGRDITDLVVTDVSPKYPILLGPKFFYKLGLKFISSIKMANCSIEYLHLQAFHGLKDLYSVNLTNVGLSTIIPTTFITNKKLRLLTISGNDLSVMSSVPYLINSSSLEELDLSRNNLMELNPHAFTQLKNIIYINLSQNNLQKIPANVFDKLETLEELDLSYNSLKSLPENIFRGTSLAILHLKYNSITDDLRFGTQNLQQLDLSFNQIHQIHQGMFEHMTGIRTLYLKGNGLTRIQTNSFFTLRQLRHIDLSINELDQISSMLFYKNTDLNVVRLNDNPRLSRLPTDGFRSHSGIFIIYYLDISNCAIGALGHKTFSTMPHLATLKLAWNNINNLERDTFTNLHKLTDLDLSNNLIVKLDDMIFMNNNDLMKLNLAGNPIHKLSIRLFLPLNNLKELDVSDCELNVLLSDVQYGVGERYKFYETLRTFNVSANQIHKISAEDIRNFKNLRSLDISNNPLNCNEGFQQFITYVSLNSNIQPYKIPTMEPLLRKLFKNGSNMRTTKLVNEDNMKLEADVGWSALAHEVCKHQDPSWIYKHSKNNNNNNGNNKNKKKNYYNFKKNNDLIDDYDVNSEDEDNMNDDVDEFKNHKILRDRTNDRKNKKMKKQQLLDELSIDDNNDNDDNDDGENMPENTNTDSINDDENDEHSEEGDNIEDDDDDEDEEEDEDDEDEEDDEEQENNDNSNAGADEKEDEEDDYMDYKKKAKIPKKFKDHKVDIDILKKDTIQNQYLLNKYLSQQNENNHPHNEQRHNKYHENTDNMEVQEPKEFIVEHGRIYYNGYRFMIPIIIIITSILLLLLIISKVIFMIMHKRGERYRLSLLQAHKNSIVYQRLSEDIKSPMENKFNNYHYTTNNNNSNNKQPKVHQYAPISQV